MIAADKIRSPAMTPVVPGTARNKRPYEFRDMLVTSRDRVQN